MREDLTQYDRKPEAMINYLRYNGPHFSKKLAEYACRMMMKKGATGNRVPVQMMTKEQLDGILKANNIEIENNQLYDHVYVACMCKADFYGSSIEDDKHLAMYVKDVIDDPDGYDGMVFNRWYADMCKMGVVIDWEEML